MAIENEELETNLKMRGPKIARAIKRRSDRVVVLARGQGGIRSFERYIRRYFDSEKIDIQTHSLYLSGGKIQTDPKDLGQLPDKTQVILFDTEVTGNGSGMASMIEWALQNRTALNLQESSLSVMTLTDDLGATNFSASPILYSVRCPVNWLKSAHPELYQKVKMDIGLLDEEVYTFRRDTEWRQRVIDGISRENEMKFSELLKFIDGFPAVLYTNRDFFENKKDCKVDEIGMIGLILDVVGRVKFKDFIGFTTQFKESVYHILNTDNRTVVLAERLQNPLQDIFFQFSKLMVERGYREYDNFRFVTVDPFGIYTVSDLFLEAFLDELELSTADIGRDVEKYCDVEVENLGQDLEEYRRGAVVVAPKSARIYGIGLCLALEIPKGQRRSRYIEIEDDEKQSQYLPRLQGCEQKNDLILPVDLDKVESVKDLYRA